MMLKRFSGRTTSYSHKFDDWANHPPDKKKCVRTIKLIDVQWTDCPVEIEQIVKKLWRHFELGNDNFIIKFNSLNDLDDMIQDAEECKIFKKYLKSQGIKANEQCFIHWWW